MRYRSCYLSQIDVEKRVFWMIDRSCRCLGVSYEVLGLDIKEKDCLTSVVCILTIKSHGRRSDF